MDNLEFRRISKYFHFFEDPHCFLIDLKSSLGEAQGVFFNFCFVIIVM